jgi:hypothetical protein
VIKNVILWKEGTPLVDKVPKILYPQMIPVKKFPFSPIAQRTTTPRKKTEKSTTIAKSHSSQAAREKVEETRPGYKQSESTTLYP